MSADTDPEFVSERPGFGNELRLAFAFLTRIPVRLPAHVGELPLAAGARAFPFAGLPVALAGAIVYAIAWTIGIPPTLAGLLAVATMAWTSGALHEDGLADFADAGGGRTRERRLEIMRDSRIGTFGVLALVVAIGLRAGALSYLADPFDVVLALAAAACASRACMVYAMHVLPPARTDGLSHAAGRPDRARMFDTLAIGAAFLLLAGPTTAIFGALFAAAGTYACIRRAQNRLGGQTGDVLGAVQQTAEIAILLAALVAQSL
ncbi:MAG: adenosylcobinamide-GDP ribazoletransferase [Alphaproteobacteria bacterium]|nr:adenosylcobinamide-GDP ribazoletransferase [Alphaproteobacteria bacterium]